MEPLIHGLTVGQTIAVYGLPGSASRCARPMCDKKRAAPPWIIGNCVVQSTSLGTLFLRLLTKWRWPGNIRELENFIERAVILSRGSSLSAPLAEIRQDANESAGATLEQMEREYIVRVLQESGGVVTTAATRLGLHRTTLNAMMKKLGISRKDL